MAVYIDNRLLDERLADLERLLEKELLVRDETSALNLRLLHVTIFSLFKSCISLGGETEARTLLEHHRIATGA